MFDFCIAFTPHTPHPRVEIEAIGQWAALRNGSKFGIETESADGEKTFVSVKRTIMPRLYVLLRKREIRFYINIH